MVESIGSIWGVETRSEISRLLGEPVKDGLRCRLRAEPPMRFVADLDCILTETVRLPMLLRKGSVRLTERPMRFVADLDCILAESICLLVVCSFPFSVWGSTVEICCD